MVTIIYREQKNWCEVESIMLHWRSSEPEKSKLPRDVKVTLGDGTVPASVPFETQTPVPLAIPLLSQSPHTQPSSIPSRWTMAVPLLFPSPRWSLSFLVLLCLPLLMTATESNGSVLRMPRKAIWYMECIWNTPVACVVVYTIYDLCNNCRYSA